jgi:hypothetical protein
VIFVAQGLHPERALRQDHLPVQGAVRQPGQPIDDRAARPVAVDLASAESAAARGDLDGDPVDPVGPGFGDLAAPPPFDGGRGFAPGVGGSDAPRQRRDHAKQDGKRRGQNGGSGHVAGLSVADHRERTGRGRRGLGGLALLLLAGPVSGVALLEALGGVPLPLALEGLADRLPFVFRLHMAASSLALPGIILALILQKGTLFHRWAGRLALAFVLAGGISALPTALLSDAIGPARLGFFAQGLAWLALAGLGWRSIRRGRVGSHRALMLMMAAVASGALWLRALLAPVQWIIVDFEAYYAALAWISWLVPLAAAAVFVRRGQPGPGGG